MSRYSSRRTAMDLEPDAGIVSEADEFPSEGDVVRVERGERSPEFNELGELSVAAAESVHGGYPNTGGTVRLSDVRLTMAMNAASKKDSADDGWGPPGRAVAPPPPSSPGPHGPRPHSQSTRQATGQDGKMSPHSWHEARDPDDLAGSVEHFRKHDLVVQQAAHIIENHFAGRTSLAEFTPWKRRVHVWYCSMLAKYLHHLMVVFYAFLQVWMCVRCYSLARSHALHGHSDRWRSGTTDGSAAHDAHVRTRVGVLSPMLGACAGLTTRFASR